GGTTGAICSSSGEGRMSGPPPPADTTCIAIGRRYLTLPRFTSPAEGEVSASGFTGRRWWCATPELSAPRGPDELAEATGVLGQDGAHDRGHHDDERARRQPAEQRERHPEEPELLLVAGHQAGQVEGGQATQRREADRGEQPADGEQPRPDPAREQDPPCPGPQRPGTSEGHQVLQDRAARNATAQEAEQVQQLDVEREADHQGQRAPGGPQPDRRQPPGQLVATLQGPGEAGRGEQGEDDTQDAEGGPRRWRRGDRRLQRQQLGATPPELPHQGPRGA